MKNALERAKAAGRSHPCFYADMPVPGARYRDTHSGMSGVAATRRYLQSDHASAMGMGCRAKWLSGHDLDRFMIR